MVRRWRREGMGEGPSGRWQRLDALVGAAPGLRRAGAAVLAAWWRQQQRAWAGGRRLAIAAPCPVIAVGGLEVGGSGKTPVAGWIIAQLLAQGRQVGLATRGYGRHSGGLVLRRRGEPACWRQLGDEAAMQVAAGLDVPVAACARRLWGARALHGLGAEVVVVDDGFSHRQLARQLDVVVLDRQAPLAGGGQLLPLGRLREPPAALGRADVVWLHDRRAQPPPLAAGWVPPELRALAPRALFVAAGQRLLPPPGRDGRPLGLAGRRLWAAAAIAKPHSFVAALSAAGAEVVGHSFRADHAPYPAAWVGRMVAQAAAAGAEAVAVTAKDAVKLLSVWPAGQMPLWTMQLQLQVWAGGPQLLHRLAQVGSHVLAPRRAAGPSNLPALPADTLGVQEPRSSIP